MSPPPRRRSISRQDCEAALDVVRARVAKAAGYAQEKVLRPAVWQGRLSWLWNYAVKKVFRPWAWFLLLLGMVLNQTSAKNAFQDLFIEGPAHIQLFSWIFALLLALSLAIRAIVYLRGPSLTDLYNPASSLRDWQLDVHWRAFDRLAELCLAPNLADQATGNATAGWIPGDCRLQDVGTFPNAPRLNVHYETWCKTIDPQKLAKDGTKYVLVNHPTSETDEHFVRLQLRKTKWSRVRSFVDLIRDPDSGRSHLFQTADPSFRGLGTPRMDLTRSSCPHSLGLHGIVVTSDNKILTMQRPPVDKTDYHPNAWSFSFEEQLADTDLDPDQPDSDVRKWIVRAVRQEVLGPDYVDKFFRVTEAKRTVTHNGRRALQRFFRGLSSIGLRFHDLGKDTTICPRPR